MSTGHDDDLVLVRTYAYRHEADVGKSMLEANDVEAIIIADDAGGLRPGLGMATGIRLLVRRSDGQKARQLLGPG
jgi:hypothetical protein